MKKKNILLMATGSQKWIGGLYYLKNVCFALLLNKKISAKYNIFIVCNENAKEIFEPFENQCTLFIRQNETSVLDKLIYLRFLIKNKIKLVYAGNYRLFYRLLRIKYVNWLPDLQFKHYPDFFNKQQLKEKEEYICHLFGSNIPVVLSSYAVLNDAKAYYNVDEKNIFIMHFVSYIGDEIKNISMEKEKNILEENNLLGKKYVLISNQFWQHKNHIIVFKMIILLKQKKVLEDIIFVFTGEMKDDRNPEYIKKLKATIEDSHIEDKIKILGFLDRSSQVILMKNSLLLLQPSLFEGWGTVVEDGKVLDKTILLSDIAVHREQMNSKCILFNPFDENDLLEKLKESLKDIKSESIKMGLENMNANALEYSRTFEKILDRYL